MDYHHFTILFVIIFSTFVLRTTVVVSRYEQTADNYTAVQRSFYAAADEAGDAFCRYGEAGIVTDKSAAYESFLYSMYASLGIMDNPIKREEFLNYIPMFAVLENDGFSINFEDEYKGEDGYHYTTRNWTESMPYSYADEDFIYCFALDGEVILYDKNGLIDGTVRIYQASQKEFVLDPLYSMLRTLRPDSFLLDEEMFVNVKQTAVIEKVTNAMRYYINNHNRIAKEYGITYDFALPVIDDSTWSRSIEYPGILVVIQGYPVDATQKIYYNQYAFIGAQIYKQEPYYLTERGWHLTYHRENCEVLRCYDEEVFFQPYFLVEDCVKQGAYACEMCIPDGVYPPERIYTVGRKTEENIVGGNKK